MVNSRAARWALERFSAASRADLFSAAKAGSCLVRWPKKLDRFSAPVEASRMAGSRFALADSAAEDSAPGRLAPAWH
jgi:hypothetical protein